MRWKKRALTFLILISLLFSGCGDKNGSIYDGKNDADTVEAEDESGCGPVKDESEMSDDFDLSDESEMSDDFDESEMSDDFDQSDESELSDDYDLSDQSGMSDDSEIDDYDGPCPPDMVESGYICIDRYEASRSNATETDQGNNTDKALSKPGVQPWMVNPMNDTHFAEFKAACNAVGKRLCQDDEWVTSCKGPENLTYSWGNTFERERCNNVDVFCDDYCLDNGISEEQCSTEPNCGYTYSCFTQMPTGSFENCTNDAGAFDINGNVWEITQLGDGYMIRGGAFNCAGASARLACNFDASWTSLYAGFRCCKDKK